MSDEQIIGVAILVALLAGVLLFVAWLIIQNVRPGWDAARLPPEQRAYHQAIVAADFRLTEAQRIYDTRLSLADATLAKAKKPRRLATCSDILLTEINLRINGRSYPLTAGISAQVDATGEVQRYVRSRITATRVVGGGLALGPAGALVGAVARKDRVAKADNRELYVVVTGPEWQEVTRLNPGLGEAARQFAAALYGVSAHAAHHQAAYTARVYEAERAREAAARETAPLMIARTQRMQLGVDPVTQRQQARLEARRAPKAVARTRR